eukprot:88428_1
MSTSSVCIITTATLILGLLSPTESTESVNCIGDCACPQTSSPATCTLNCDGKNQCKDSTMKCRSGDHCIINCIGESACEGNTNLDATDAIDVTISCNGRNACKGNTIVNCGTGHCSILCELSTSCSDTSLYADNAASFECIGKCNSFAVVPAPFAAPTTQRTSSKLTRTPSTTTSASASQSSSTSSTNKVGSETSASTMIVKDSQEEATDSIMVQMSSNPMWFLMIGFAVIIMTASVIFGCKMLRKRKSDQTIQPKDTLHTNQDTNRPPLPQRAPPTKRTYSGNKPPTLPPRKKSTQEGNSMSIYTVKT